MAQPLGYVIFANLEAGVDAPVFAAAGNAIAAPSPYVADLFWSITTNAVMDSLTPLGHTTSFLDPAQYGSGYFIGGAVSLPAADLLAEVRVWDTNYGPTYYEARDNGGEFGFSNLIIVRPIFHGPSALSGLQSFRLQRLPRLSISSTTTNTLLLSWSVEVNTYALQENHNLEPGGWVTITNMPVIVGSENQVIIPKSTGNRFYRLISE